MDKQLKLCIQCLRIMDKGGKYCKHCLKERIKAHKRKQIVKRRVNLLCTYCGNPMDRIGWICKACNITVSYNQKLKTQYRRDNHLCVKCAIPLLDDKATCPACRKKVALYRKQHRDKAKKRNEELYKNLNLNNLKVFYSNQKKDVNNV